MFKIKVKPTSYSHAKTTSEVKKCIKLWPKQDTNNENAFKHSVEFVIFDHPDGPVGTLSEYAKFDDISEFEIVCIDGVIKVKKDEENFVEVN